MSATPYTPEQPIKSVLVNVFMKLAERRQAALVSPHLGGGIDIDKVQYEYDSARTLWKAFDGRLQLNILNGMDVVDIGCGWGGKMINYAEHSRLKSIVGFDLPGVMDPSVPTKYANQKGLANCSFTTGFAEDMPFENGRFDVAIMDDVLEHVQDPEKMLDESWRVLRPGGLVIARFPSIKMMGAHHLDRALTYPALHYLMSLKTWAAGLNYCLLESRGSLHYEPFDEVVATKYHEAVTRNLNGMDFTAFRRISKNSGFRICILELVGIKLVNHTVPKRALWGMYRFLRSTRWFREFLSISIAFVGQK